MVAGLHDAIGAVRFDADGRPLLPEDEEFARAVGVLAERKVRTDGQTEAPSSALAMSEGFADSVGDPVTPEAGADGAVLDWDFRLVNGSHPRPGARSVSRGFPRQGGGDVEPVIRVDVEHWAGSLCCSLVPGESDAGMCPLTACQNRTK